MGRMTATSRGYATRSCKLKPTSLRIQQMGINRRIVDDLLYVRFVTFSVFRRRKLLNHDHAKRMLLGWFNEVLNQYQATCDPMGRMTATSVATPPR